MRRVFFSLLLTAALACGEAPSNGIADQVQTTTIERRLAPGDVHRYAFSWHVETASDRGLLGEEPVGGGLALTGELELRVLAETDAGTTIGMRFVRLDEHRIHVHGQDVMPEPSALLDHEAVVVVPADGDTRRVLFDPASPSVFRHMVTGFLRHVDLRLPPSSRWRTVVPTGNGLAEVEYVPAAGERAFTRHLRRYERVDAVAGVPASAPWQIHGGATIVLDDDGLPSQLESSELLVLSTAEQPISFDGSTQVKLSRRETVHGPLVDVPDLTGWVEADLFDPPDEEEAERELARRFAEGLTMTDLTIAVQSAGRGLRPSPGFHVRARGLLRGWPELATELVELFDEAPSHIGRAFVLDLLVSADTHESQEVIAKLLDHDRKAEDLPRLLQHLGLLRTPTRTTAELLLDLYARARIEGDDVLRQSVLYPLGTLTPAIAAADPELGELLLVTMRNELRDATTTDDRRAALSGLGNAGFAADVPAILAHTSDPDTAVRLDAVSALRFYVHDARVDDVLFDAVGDAERIVGAGALHVIDRYRPEDGVIERLAQQVIDSDYHPELRGPIISVLARRGIENPMARQGLVALLERTTDAREERRIRRVLGRV